MENPIVVVAVDVRGSDDAIRQAEYVASWIGNLRADAYIIYITDSKLVKRASLADDEYFSVAERRKFIIEGCIEKGKQIVEKLKIIFKKYGIHSFEQIEIADPVSEVSKIARETNAMCVIPFGIPTTKLIKRCPSPIVLVPKEDKKGFTDIIKEKIAIKLPILQYIG